jgi:hypothetical protein
MVDTINELSSIALKLNQKSDQLNALITSINENLARLNFGIEVWLESHPVKENGNAKAFLGYCKSKDEWQLAIWDPNDALELEDRPSVRLAGSNVWPLAEVSRELRLLAMPLIPKLLDGIKEKAEDLLKGLEAAERAAESLGDRKSAGQTKLTLREVSRSRSGPIAGSGPVIQLAVQGLPAGQEAFIANMGSNAKESWQILRIKNGAQGDWTGAYKKAVDALAALQREFD